MNPRRRRLGFIVAAAGMLAALALPLSSEAAGGLPARPILLALTLAAALLFAAAAWAGGLPAIALGLTGVLCGAATTLVLLHDAGIAGAAAAAFWAMVLAVWLGAALCVVQLASERPRDDASRIVSNALSISLKFASKNAGRATPTVNNRTSASLQHRPRTPGRFINSIPPGLL